MMVQPAPGMLMGYSGAANSGAFLSRAAKPEFLAGR